MASLVNRMVRAAKLESALYEEVEADSSALRQAMGVVVIASVAAGIGNMAYGGVIGLVAGVIAALIGWFIWAGLTYLIGTKLLPEPQTEADIGQLLRTLGFASAPGVLRVFGFIPILGPIIFLISSIWMLVATVVAVRQALEYKSTGRAVGVIIIGWIVMVVLMTLVAAFTGGAAGVTDAAL